MLHSLLAYILFVLYYVCMCVYKYTLYTYTYICKVSLRVSLFIIKEILINLAALFAPVSRTVSALAIQYLSLWNTLRLHSSSEFILNNAYLLLVAVISHNTQLSAYHCLIKESSFPFHQILPSFQLDLVLRAQSRSNS